MHNGLYLRFTAGQIYSAEIPDEDSVDVRLGFSNIFPRKSYIEEGKKSMPISEWGTLLTIVTNYVRAMGIME